MGGAGRTGLASPPLYSLAVRGPGPQLLPLGHLKGTSGTLSPGSKVGKYKVCLGRGKEQRLQCRLRVNGEGAPGAGGGRGSGGRKVIWEAGFTEAVGDRTHRGGLLQPWPMGVCTFWYVFLERRP